MKLDACGGESERGFKTEMTWDQTNPVKQESHAFRRGSCQADGMLTMTYAYKLEPTPQQVLDIEENLNVRRKAWDYVLGERKDWCASRKSVVNACLIRGEYIFCADEPFPDYHIQARRLTAARKNLPELGNAHSQILQQTLRQLEQAWDDMRKRGFGFPRFKKRHSLRSFAFPQLRKTRCLQKGLNCPKLA